MLNSRQRLTGPKERDFLIEVSFVSGFGNQQIEMQAKTVSEVEDNLKKKFKGRDFKIESMRIK